MIFVVVGCPDHILERIDIVFLGQFDSSEHASNISLMIGCLVVVAQLPQNFQNYCRKYSEIGVFLY